MTMAETQTTMFEFTGNNLCLDFCNTLNDRKDNPRELQQYVVTGKQLTGIVFSVI